MFRPTGWIYALPLSNIDYGQTLSLNNRYYALGLFTNFAHRMTISCMHYGKADLILSFIVPIYDILMHIISLFEVWFLKAFWSDQISHVILGYRSILFTKHVNISFIIIYWANFLVKTKLVIWTSMNYTKRLHHHVFCIFFQWKKKMFVSRHWSELASAHWKTLRCIMYRREPQSEIHCDRNELSSILTTVMFTFQNRVVQLGY